MQKILLLMLCVLVTSAAFPQTTITGNVTASPEGEALPGVSILVKDTNTGTTTDSNGNYTLQVPANGKTLVFSFIGYARQEVEIGNRSVINIQLEEDIFSLAEIVVVGYGTSTEKQLTGSVSSVKGADLIALNPTRVDQALQGQVAGVMISSASGSPGGGLNIRIRGLSTNGDNAPLILVDGIPYSEDGLNALNPADIESINVLKDATAAIYGVRGANGVIFITTKQGKRNSKPTIEFNGYYGIQETARKLDLLNAREYAVLKNESFGAALQAPPFNNTNLGNGTDWQEEVFQQAPIQNYHMNLNGGSEKSNYAIGFSYLDQEGIVGGDRAGFSRYNARLNFATDLTEKITLQNVMLYTNERRSTLPENTISSVLYNTINASPIAAVRDAEGNFTYLEEVNDVINPLAQMENSFNGSRVNKLVGKQELTYKINDRFELAGRAGYNYANVTNKTFSPLVYYGSGKAQNTTSSPDLVPDSLLLFSEGDVAFRVPVFNNVRETQETFFNYNLEAFLNYTQTFNTVHRVKGTIGASIFGDRGENNESVAYNVPYNSFDFADISLAEGAHLLSNVSSWQTRSRLLSYFLRAEYAYEDKYLFSAIIRRDASSRFGKNNRFGYFPSFSAAWIISEESFLNVDALNFLKLRASYGVLGNDRIGDFRYRGLLGGEGVYPFGDQLVQGVAMGTLGNPDLKWETTHQTNIGIDAELFNERFSVTADYYVKITKDLLFRPDVSGVVGAYGAGTGLPYVNGGDVRNTGFEFVIGYNAALGKDFGINVTYNLTTVRNEVTSLPPGVDFFEYGSFGVGGPTATRMETGYPIGYFFGYKTEGVYQSAAEVAERGTTQAGAQPGDLKYADLSGDGTVNFSDDSDKTIIGSPIPDALMGLNASLNFKGFDFSFMLYASIGNEILRNYERQQPLANLLGYKISRWTGEGSTNEHPRLTNATNTNAEISDYFVEDGSFLRVRNVQLGYSLPASIVSKMKATKLRVYVAANNLFTFTKYRGYDPDFSTDDPLVSGIDFGFYPQARMYMAGFNLNF